MFWKKKENEIEQKIQQMNEILKKSFANVKRDTTNIFQWLNYFYRKGIEQEQLIKQLQLELSYIPKTREEIRHIIDEYYSFEGIMAKIRDLNNKVEEVARRFQVRSLPQPVHEIAPEIVEVERRLNRLEQKRLSMKEKIIKRLTRNSKEYVKGIIISYVKKYERISAVQLKELVVDEQNLCSKSSFYRLLEEIEQLDDIGVVKHGKEKYYISKIVARI